MITSSEQSESLAIAVYSLCYEVWFLTQNCNRDSVYHPSIGIFHRLSSAFDPESVLGKVTQVINKKPIFDHLIK